MARIVEFHLLQNFAPSNLNRDDTGAPKDAVFGGVRRARISSQCVKRAVRLHFAGLPLLKEEELADRTKAVASRLATALAELGHPDAEAAIKHALESLKLSLVKKKEDSEAKTEYLLFIGRGEVRRLAEAIAQHFDEFAGGKPGKVACKAVDQAIGAARAADIALFGRMLADRKDFNIDAAAQVAHAISTHRVDRDVDYFTALDDFAQADEAAAGMLGTVEFNSSCFYRYAVVNLDLLERNLGADVDLAQRTMQSFLRGFVEAIPTGKQNSFAAHNPPSFVAIGTRRGAPMNLANAFEKPVFHGEDERGLTAASVLRLQGLANRYGTVYQPLDLCALDLTGAWQGPSVQSVAELESVLARGLSAMAGT